MLKAFYVEQILQATNWIDFFYEVLRWSFRISVVELYRCKLLFRKEPTEKKNNYEAGAWMNCMINTKMSWQDLHFK